MPVTKCEPETTRKASRKYAKTQETVLSALLPGWMCAPHPQTDTTERTDNLADAA